MIVITCPLCGQRFETDDPSQNFTVWDEVNGMWELICDPCADKVSGQ